MNKSAVITLLKKLDTTDLAGEKVMIDFESGKYFLLKGVANDIWEMIQEPISLDEMVSKLLAEYDIDQETCESSVVKFLDQLKEFDFISVE